MSADFRAMTQLISVIRGNICETGGLVTAASQYRTNTNKVR